MVLDGAQMGIVLNFFSFCKAGVFAVATDFRVVFADKVMSFDYIVDVRGCPCERVHVTALRIDADFYFLAGMPLISLLGLMHFRDRALSLRSFLSNLELP